MRESLKKSLEKSWYTTVWNWGKRKWHNRKNRLKLQFSSPYLGPPPSVDVYSQSLFITGLKLQVCLQWHLSATGVPNFRAALPSNVERKAQGVEDCGLFDNRRRFVSLWNKESVGFRLVISEMKIDLCLSFVFLNILMQRWGRKRIDSARVETLIQ